MLGHCAAGMRPDIRRQGDCEMIEEVVQIMDAKILSYLVFLMFLPSDE